VACGATQVLDHGGQAVARGSARCLLHVLGRSARAYACSRSFAVFSAQLSAASLRLRHSRLTCGSMLEVRRDAVAAAEEQLVSCTGEQSKYCFICTVTLCPCGDLLFTSWGRWQCLRGGADAGLDSCYAACSCGTEYQCWGHAGERRVATRLRRWRALPLAVQWFQC
jgi:hypothetical protein